MSNKKGNTPVIFNRDFMQITKPELQELDDLLDKKIKEASRGLEEAKWEKNERPYQSDIFLDAEKGGESNED